MISPLFLVAAFVLRGDELLLTHRLIDLKENRWEVPVGSIRTGMTPSESAAAMLFEETGLTATTARFFGNYRNDHVQRDVQMLLLDATGELISSTEDQYLRQEWHSMAALPPALGETTVYGLSRLGLIKS